MIYRFILISRSVLSSMCGRIILVPHIYEDSFGINEIYQPNLKKKETVAPFQTKNKNVPIHLLNRKLSIVFP